MQATVMKEILNFYTRYVSVCFEVHETRKTGSEVLTFFESNGVLEVVCLWIMSRSDRLRSFLFTNSRILECSGHASWWDQHILSLILIVGAMKCLCQGRRPARGTGSRMP